MSEQMDWLPTDDDLADLAAILADEESESESHL